MAQSNELRGKANMASSVRAKIRVRDITGQVVGPRQRCRTAADRLRREDAPLFDRELQLLTGFNSAFKRPTKSRVQPQAGPRQRPLRSSLRKGTPFRSERQLPTPRSKGGSSHR